MEILEEVFRRLQEHGIRLNPAKCIFFQSGLEFLGHWIDKNGIRPLPQKMDAVMQAKSPTNVTELKSYLGLLNYYAKFLPNLATTLHPLHDLLQKDRPWKWTEACERAFVKSKKQLEDSPLLVHYDLKKSLWLACDASPYGVGAVISHVMENGEEKPIAFASRTLTASEHNYFQIEKEALSIVFGVKKFHSYLYGWRFTLLTDHQPLVTILGPKTGVPPLAAARMQRWSLILAAYQYEIEYRKSAEHANADALSRLVQASLEEQEEEEEVYLISYLEELPVTAQDIAAATGKDPVLARVYDFTLHGWPQVLDDQVLQPYFSRKQELSVDQGCVLWGFRVVIPEKHRVRLLDDWHQEHHGICRMKSLARGYFWWPGLDAAIVERVQQCHVCAAVGKSPPKAPLYPWKWPAKPWERIHIDFFEKGKFNFLIVVDGYSKWLEVIPMGSMTSLKTIEVLHSFARYGIPEEVVSDNGPQLASEEFAQFLKQNGVKFTQVPPYHPASNAVAERSVQTAKMVLTKQVLEGKANSLSLEHRLANFLYFES